MTQVFNTGVYSADEPLYEVINGQRVEEPVMGFYECGIASDLMGYLLAFARANQLGRARMETLFVIDRARGLERRPDVAFVSYERWPKDRKMPRRNAWDVIPDLAIEIISPTNLAEQIAVKIDEYFRAGVHLVWVIYPVPCQIYVYESPSGARILKKDEELNGGLVLPGWRLPVSALFEDELEDNPPVSES